MISFVKGELVSILEDKIVVENGGMGFNIFVSKSDLENLPALGDEVKIHTFLSVKEDSISLFGFISEEDLSMFRMLISVSGVGPKGALGILSYMSGNGLKLAIASDDAKGISKAPGIGLKTAQKIIIELKGKIDLEDAISNIKPKGMGANADEFDEEKTLAVEALVSLGYSNSESTKVVKKVVLENPEIISSEEIIKMALKNML